VRLFFVLLVACWTGSAPPPPPPSVPEPPPPRAKRPFEPCTEQTFDKFERTCRHICAREAPDGWPACVTLAKELVTQGWRCTDPTPFACAPPQQPVPATCPATGCASVRARVIAVSVQGNAQLVTVSAGKSQGVDKTWRATFVDANNVPIPGGSVTMIRIHDHQTIGTTQLPMQQIQQTPHVRLDP
jgi:hypothetical protein